MDFVKISVIIPTYNRADFLPRAIDSVLAQSFQADEIIIIDDGSTDSTKEVIKQYEKNIIYKYQKNGGVSSARNSGIKLAKNPWIAFLDSDDAWHEDKLLKQIALQSKNPALHFIHTAEEWIRNEKRVTYPKSLKKPEGWCFLENTPACKIAASSVLLKKVIFEKLGYFDENLTVCEDYDMWLRISYDYEIGLVDEALVTKYAGHEQLSSTIFAIDAYHVDVLQKYLCTKHKEEVKKVLRRKILILLKGAQKHKNRLFLDKYNKLLATLG